jgi:hypothetical protein
MKKFLSFTVIASALMVVGTLNAQAPSCGNIPCISLQNDSSNPKRCEPSPATVLVNHANKSAKVTVEDSANGKSRGTVVYNAGPNSKTDVGCAGINSAAQNVTYRIVSVQWQ